MSPGPQCTPAILWMRQWCLGTPLEVVLGSVQVYVGEDKWAVTSRRNLGRKKSETVELVRPGPVQGDFPTILMGHQFAPSSMGCICPAPPPPPSRRRNGSKSIPRSHSFPRLSWIARCVVSRMQFVLLEKGKACIDNAVIGPVIAVWVFKIGD